MQPATENCKDKIQLPETSNFDCLPGKAGGLPASLALHMRHVIDGPVDLRFDVLERRLAMAVKKEIGKAAQCLCPRSN
jgi:hypothetical protein